MRLKGSSTPRDHDIDEQTDRSSRRRRGCCSSRSAGSVACLAAGYGVLFTIVDDYRDTYGISESSIGMVIGLGFLAGFLSQLLIAPYADRGHARKIVLVGVLVNVVGLVLMAVSTTLLPILLGRFISGIGVGAAAPAVRRIVILADPKNLGANLGRLLAADVFGFALGPAISALLVGTFGITSPFLVVAALTLVLLPFVARVRVNDPSELVKRRLAVDLLRIKPFAGAVVMGSAVFVMIGTFDALWALVHKDLGTSEWIANIGITLFALPLVVLGPIGGRLVADHRPVQGRHRRPAVRGDVPVPVRRHADRWRDLHRRHDPLGVRRARRCRAPGWPSASPCPDDRQAGAQGVLGAAQALAAGAMAVITGTLYEASGRFAAYTMCALAMVTLVGIGLWLARSAWSLKRPIGDSTADGPASVASPLSSRCTEPGNRARPAGQDGVSVR